MSFAETVPCEPSYLQALGRVIFAFSALEYNVVWLTDFLRKELGIDYIKWTAGGIARDLEKAIEATSLPPQTLTDCRSFLTEFRQLTSRRNDVLHAHPSPESRKSHILRRLTPNDYREIRWAESDLCTLAEQIESAADRLGQFSNEYFFGPMLERSRKNRPLP